MKSLRIAVQMDPIETMVVRDDTWRAKARTHRAQVDMRAPVALLATVALAGCFSSEEALVTKSDAVVPIRDGAVYELRSSEQGDPAELVRFSRVGNGYELRHVDGEDAPMRLMFASVVQTHDDDYIAQVDFESQGGRGFGYAFLWPLGDDRYRVYTQATRLDDAGRPISDSCAEVLFGCSFDSADEMRRYYLDVLYPIFSSGRQLANYSELVPVETTAAPRGRK